MIEVIYEMAGVQLVPLDWVTKRRKEMVEVSSTPINGPQVPIPAVARCPCCNTELVVQLEPKSGVFFAKTLKQVIRETKWVEKTTSESALRPSQFEIRKFQNGVGWTRSGIGRNDNPSSRFSKEKAGMVSERDGPGLRGKMEKCLMSLMSPFFKRGIRWLANRE